MTTVQKSDAFINDEQGSNMNKDIRDLAMLVANIIRRMGADYGSPEDWRLDITAAVQIMERNNIAVQS